jgi:hypothetical protein
LNELNTNLHSLIDKVKSSYATIEQTTGIKLHDSVGIDNFKERIGQDVSLFMNFSRGKAKQAQAREFVIFQPKESLSTLSKAKITINNYLGGQYFLTVDEVVLSTEKVRLIESKHSKSSILPSKSDVKDGLLKMILYSNLLDVFVDEQPVKSEAILCLTSPKISGAISSINEEEEIADFFSRNNFSNTQKGTITTIITEAKQNNFIVKLQYSK